MSHCVRILQPSQHSLVGEGRDQDGRENEKYLRLTAHASSNLASVLLLEKDGIRMDGENEK